VNLDHPVERPRQGDDITQYLSAQAAAAQVRGDIHAPDVASVAKLGPLAAIETHHGDEVKISERAEHEGVRIGLELRGEMTQRPPHIGLIIRRECGWAFLQSLEPQCTEGLCIARGEQAYFHDKSSSESGRTGVKDNSECEMCGRQTIFTCLQTIRPLTSSK